MRSGKVWLVGAGPGDAALITVKGLHAIRQAEALVYDRLVCAELLAEAPDGCEMINVGKTPNNHLVPQPQINQILIDCAQRGLNVVRLKGGDPYVSLDIVKSKRCRPCIYRGGGGKNTAGIGGNLP